MQALTNPSKVANNELLTVAQTARILCLQPVTLRLWARRRKIAVHRLGRTVRIPASEVERLLRESLIPASGDTR